MADDIWIFQDQPIPVSFDTRGSSFYRGGRGILHTPVETNLRLTYVKGGEKTLLLRVSDLEGKVCLDTPGQALEFVRLFSAIDTHYLFPDYPYMEPREGEDQTGPGEYAPSYTAKVNLAAPGARREGEAFIVERNLLDRQNRLFRSRERVDPDGHYTLEDVQIIDGRSPIAYPLYQ
jgi:hypothetical protein